MNILLDTHILLWWLTDDRRLKKLERDLLIDSGNPVSISVVSYWEIVIKTANGRLEAELDEVLKAVDQSGFSTLPIHARHTRALADLPPHHADPFDRMLVAQAQADSLRLLTRDQKIAAYGPVVMLV